MNELDSLLDSSENMSEKEFLKLYIFLLNQITFFDFVQLEMNDTSRKLNEKFGNLKLEYVATIIHMFQFEFACSIRRMIEFLIDHNFDDKKHCKYNFPSLNFLRTKFKLAFDETASGKIKLLVNEEVIKLATLKCLLEQERIHYYQSDFKFYSKFFKNEKFETKPKWSLNYLYSFFVNVIFDIDTARGITKGFIDDNETIFLKGSPLNDLFNLPKEKNLLDEKPFYPFSNGYLLRRQIAFKTSPVIRKWNINSFFKKQ